MSYLHLATCQNWHVQLLLSVSPFHSWKGPQTLSSPAGLPRARTMCRQLLHISHGHSTASCTLCSTATPEQSAVPCSDCVSCVLPLPCHGWEKPGSLCFVPSQLVFLSPLFLAPLGTETSNSHVETYITHTLQRTHYYPIHKLLRFLGYAREEVAPCPLS